MNILHVKYAVEVARVGSINKASETLLIAQPNLSRSIKELEADLGITIFDRSARGMVLTHDGEDFIHRAKLILSQIDEVESFYRGGHDVPLRFSVSAPAAGYISAAMTALSVTLGNGSAQLCFREAGSSETLASVIASECKLGIVRYPASEDRTFKSMLEEKGLSYELVAESTFCVIAHPGLITERRALNAADLSPLTEVCCASSAPPSSAPSSSRIISVSGRGAALELISANPSAYMWSSPEPAEVLERYGVAKYTYSEGGIEFRDMLIYRRDYRLSECDRSFTTELCRARRAYLK